MTMFRHPGKKPGALAERESHKVMFKRSILGQYRDNGKENGNYYNATIMGLYRV